MNVSRPFIERPVATSLLMVALLLSGLVAYRMLSTSALPEVDYPTIQVTTLYPGASPDVMTSAVTAPLEKQFGQMPGLDLDDVGPGLALDVEDDARRAVGPRGEVHVLRAVHGLGDVAEPHRRAVHVGDDDALVLGGGLELVVGVDR